MTGDQSADEPPASSAEVKAIGPQEGPQTEFLSTAADIAWYGGAAGGGKSWGLLIEPLRHANNSRFGAVIFRRNNTQVRNEGGLWDESAKLYPLLGARGSRHALTWRFPSGMRVRFAQLEHEDTKHDWQGTQISFIGFDELTHFTESQFFYFLSRLRSMSGVRGYVRGTTNPLVDSWVERFITWWIDQDPLLEDGTKNPRYGLPIPERSGVIRWFVRAGDTIVWGDSRQELVERYGADAEPLSFTFISARVTDNKILLAANPSYMAGLKALSRVERERLLHGNWKVRSAAGMFYRREWFKVVDAPPADAKRIRFWDRAATEPRPGTDPDWTGGVKVSRDKTGIFYVEHVIRMQRSAYHVDQAILNAAAQDGSSVTVGIYKDPGSAGKGEAEATARRLAPFVVFIESTSNDKQTRAKNSSSQAEAGNICIVRGGWNEAFLSELENFPEGAHDDQVDPFASGVNWLSSARKILVA